MSDRVRPLLARQGAASDDRVDLNPAGVAGLLAQIGALGERIEATARRSVDALRQAQSETDVETWDGSTAESLLELAAHIEAQRCRLDVALERDRAQLSGKNARTREPVTTRKR